VAAVKGRAHRTGVPDAVKLQARVAPSRYAKAQAAADALGVSLGTYLDELLEREQVDELGRPLWWPANQEELPLTRSA